MTEQSGHGVVQETGEASIEIDAVEVVIEIVCAGPAQHRLSRQVESDSFFVFRFGAAVDEVVLRRHRAGVMDSRWCRAPTHGRPRSLVFHVAPCSACGVLSVHFALPPHDLAGMRGLSPPSRSRYMQYRRPPVEMISRSRPWDIFSRARSRMVPGLTPSCAATSSAVLNPRLRSRSRSRSR